MLFVLSDLWVTAVLLCIIATLAGARSARLVSLEAAAALTGRFFVCTLSGIACAAPLRHGVRSRSSVSSLPSLALGRLCSSRSRQQQLSLVASSISRSTGIVCAVLLRHGVRSRSSASSLPSLALGLLCSSRSILHFYGTVYDRAPRHHRYPRWCSVCSARLARWCTSTARVYNRAPRHHRYPRWRSVGSAHLTRGSSSSHRSLLRSHALPASPVLHFYGTVYGRAPRHHRYPRWCLVGSLVSLEAAAALTGRFFDRTLYSTGIVCAALPRHGVRSRSSASSLPSLALGRLCSSHPRQQRLSLVASSTSRSPASPVLHFYGTAYGRAPRHHRYPRWCSVCSARLARCCTSTARLGQRYHRRPSFGPKV